MTIGKSALFCSLAVSAELTSCKESGPERYEVHVRCLLSDRSPVAGVELTGDAQTAQSDAQGVATFFLRGNEGAEVALSVTKVPPGLELGDHQPERQIYLKRLGKAHGVIVHDLPLLKKRETYVVMVAAEHAADLPVYANGAEVAFLNSRSAAAFRIDAEPKSELKVMLDTKGNKRASEPNPVHVFLLPPGSAVLAHRYNLVITDPPPPRKPPPPPKKNGKQRPWDED